MTHLEESIDTNESPTTDAATDRRAMLRKMAIGGAGAAVAVTALGRTAQAGDQAGTQIGGNAVELGETNTATLPTIIDVTPAAPLTQGPSAFSAGGYVPTGTSPLAAGVGGYGDATIPNGVHGSTTVGTGYGVVAASLTTAAPASTDPVPAALAVASAFGAQVKFLPLPGSVSGPTPGVHSAGELYVDKDGTLWFTVPAPTATAPNAVRFVELAGTQASGAYHAIDPQRAYDSRQPNYTQRGPLTRTTSRVVSVADGHSPNGTVTVPNAVPVGATAVMINLTAAETTDKNFLAVTRGDATSTSTSAVNWDVGVTQIANALPVNITASREIKVFCGDQPGSAHFIVDVFGYYL
jgi:hypothetical protein